MDNIVIYCDGVFDLFHMGHRKHLKYLKSLHKNSTLVVGIVGDKDAQEYKRKPIFDEKLRYNLIKNTRHADKIILPCPLSTTREFILENGITHIYHAFVDEKDREKQKEFFKIPISMGIFHEIPYNTGISTTKIIESIQGCKPDWNINKITVQQQQGLTNTNFRLSFGTDNLFLRLYTDITPKKDINILYRLNAHGFGAKILDVFEGGRIEEWLDGRVITREDLTVENIQKLSQLIKQFHTMGVCHNDLNLTNILIKTSRELCIIDWEYCKENSDILYDIANFFIEWMYDYYAEDWYKPKKELFPTKEEMEIFCKEYGEGVNIDNILSRIPEVHKFWIDWVNNSKIEEYRLFKRYRLEFLN